MRADTRTEFEPTHVVIVVGRKWHAPELASGLEANDCRVTVVTTEIGHFTSGTVRVRLRTLLRIAGRYSWLAPAMHKIFTTLARSKVRRLRPDLVIAWSSFMLELDPTVAPIVVVRGSHNIRTQRAILQSNPHKSRLPSLAMVKREEAEYARASLIQVPTAEIAHDSNWSGTKVVPISYGFPPMGREDAHTELSPDRKSALFVGEYSFRKGYDRLGLLEQIAGIERVLLIGRSPRNEHWASPAKSRDLGQLSSAEVYRRMRGAGFLVLLSREEGQARVGLEAMACGLPLLVTPASGLGDWCARGAGVVVSNSPSIEEVERAVRAIAGDWEGFSARAQELAQTWTWVDHARSLLAEMSLRSADALMEDST